MSRFILIMSLCVCLASGCAGERQPGASGKSPVGDDGNKAGTTNPGITAPLPKNGGDAEDIVSSVALEMGSEALLEAIKWTYESFDPDIYYGKTMEYFCGEYYHVYYWYPDGTEYVVNSSRSGRLLFSGDVWSEGSKCVGALVEFPGVFSDYGGEPLSPAEVEAATGGETVWNPGDAGEPPRYECALGEGKIKVYTNGDGSKLREDAPVLVQFGKEEVSGIFPPYEEKEDALGKKRGAHWDAMERYASRLGEEKSVAVKAENPLFVKDMYDQDCYKDAEGTVFRYHGVNGLEGEYCGYIEVPATKIFPELLENDISPRGFLKMLDCEIRWTISDLYPQYLEGEEWVIHRESGATGEYRFNNGDLLVGVSSSADGVVTENDRVFMKRPGK